MARITTISYAVSTDYIKNLVEDCRTKGYKVHMADGIMKVMAGDNEVFWAINLGNRWLLRGDPDYFTIEDDEDD